MWCDLFQTSAVLNLADYWNPKLYIENILGELMSETIWSTAVTTENDEVFMFEQRRVRGTFTVNMKLREFPFDTQVKYLYSDNKSGL